MSLLVFWLSFSLTVRHTPSVIPTVECSDLFVPFGSWGVRCWFSLRFEAQPAFPSVPTLESGLWFVAFHGTTSSLRESAGLFGYFFYLAVRHTPRVIPTIKCSVPFVLFGSWSVRCWFPLGFEALPAFPSLLTLEFGI